jgi:hypothetical protein
MANAESRLTKLEAAHTPPTCPRCGQNLCGAAAERERRFTLSEKLLNGDEFAREFAKLIAGDSQPGGEDGRKT